jgi:sporulation integral membrane protein YtvI
MDREYPLNPKERTGLWQRLGIRLGILAVLLVFLIVILPRIFGVMLPFLLGILFAWAVNPLVRAITRSTKIPRKPIALLIIIVIMAGIGTILVLAVYTAVEDFITLTSNWQTYWANMKESLNIIAGRFNILPERVDQGLNNLLDTIFSMMEDRISGFAEQGTTRASGLVSGVSGVFITIIAFILSAYFFTVDFTRFHIGASQKLGRGLLYNLNSVGESLSSSMGGYIKQQLFLSLLAFGMMVIGFALLKQKYMLVIAVFITIVDFIPALGTGTVLIPWGIVCILAGRFPKGIGLLALWVVIRGVRILIKSKLPKTKSALTVFQVIIFIYAGIKIGGIAGALWCPLLVMALVQIYRTGIFEKAEKDFVCAFRDLKALCSRRTEENSGSGN